MSIHPVQHFVRLYRYCAADFFYPVHTAKFHHSRRKPHKYRHTQMRILAKAFVPRAFPDQTRALTIHISHARRIYTNVLMYKALSVYNTIHTQAVYALGVWVRGTAAARSMHVVENIDRRHQHHAHDTRPQYTTIYTCVMVMVACFSREYIYV